MKKSTISFDVTKYYVKIGRFFFSNFLPSQNICLLLKEKTYLKRAVFDITFGQIATMNSVVKSECRNMRCGETTLLAQEFFHRGVYY